MVLGIPMGAKPTCTTANTWTCLHHVKDAELQFIEKPVLALFTSLKAKEGSSEPQMGLDHTRVPCHKNTATHLLLFHGWHMLKNIR
ncbi:hypothetical protein Y1Q_0002354 [Alligator mississippiensis]|uniref:Uncharacterized protein n=1 Tax=Alligator mississippiensis TaxID=8496 RepID=A0A151MGT3_ALLMI|nr:hypothetical protein Y1Q_0002354 [Alligator mississippiensis]